MSRNLSRQTVIDRDGNMVALTQTLLSLFGAKVVLPETGVLMNNGINWFDPRPGRPNSIGPGRRPLSNMLPLLGLEGEAPWLALGASGGRRILPAVLQLVSFMADFGLSNPRRWPRWRSASRRARASSSAGATPIRSPTPARLRSRSRAASASR